MTRWRTTTQDSTTAFTDRRARETTRGPLTINGDTAVISGEQHNRTAKPDGSVSTSSLMATQIFRRHPGGWQLVLMHLTQKGAE